MNELGKHFIGQENDEIVWEWGTKLWEVNADLYSHSLKMRSKLQLVLNNLKRNYHDVSECEGCIPLGFPVFHLLGQLMRCDAVELAFVVLY